MTDCRTSVFIWRQVICTFHGYPTAANINDLSATDAFGLAPTTTSSPLHSVHIHVAAMDLNKVRNSDHTDVSTAAI